MTLRERILSVYAGQTPDVVPYALDLFHWFYHKFHLPWDLDKPYMEPDSDLIDYHRMMGVGFYFANCASFYDSTYAGDVEASVIRDESDGVEIVWRYETPIGKIERRRK